MWARGNRGNIVWLSYRDWRFDAEKGGSPILQTCIDGGASAKSSSYKLHPIGLRRERKVKDLMEVVDENTKSKALFAAADYAIRMRGGTTAVPTGQIAELLQLAQEQGSVTPHEIAEVLDTDTVAVNYDSGRFTVAMNSEKILVVDRILAPVEQRYLPSY